MRIVGYPEILEGVRNARRWYEELRIPTSGTRLEKIQSRIEEILDGIANRQPEDFLQGRSSDQDFYALSDGLAFEGIYRHLSPLRSDRLPRTTLREALQGPLSPTEERPGTEDVHARNFFMELELASHIAESGLPILDFDDIQFAFNDMKFSVQCKRLGSRRNIPHNIKKAYEQLQRVPQDEMHKGLIALSVEKIFGLDGPWLPAMREDDIVREVLRWTHTFTYEHHDSWMDFTDRRVIGLVLVFKILCHTLPQNVVGPAYYPTVVPLVRSGHPDHHLLLDFGQQLRRIQA